MLKRLLLSYLLKKFGRYIQGLNYGDLETDFWNGRVALNNLQLQAEFLKELNLPVELELSHIGRLEFTIPWSSLWSKSVIVEIHDVVMLTKTSEPWKKSRNEIEQIRSLVRDNLLQQLFQTGDNAGKGSQEQGKLAKTLRSILERIEVRIYRVHFRLYLRGCRNQRTHSSHGAIGAFIDSIISLPSIDQLAEKNHDPVDSSSPIEHQRRIVCRLCTLYSDTKHRGLDGKTSEQGIAILHGIADQVRNLTDVEHVQELVRVQDLEIKIDISGGGTSFSTSATQVSVSLGEISLSVVHQLFAHLEAHSAWWQVYTSRSHIRPLQNLKEQDSIGAKRNVARAWWRFAYLLVRDRGPRTHHTSAQWDWRDIRRAGVDRRAYIAAFQNKLKSMHNPKGSTLSPSQLKLLRMVERKYDVQVVALFQAIAQKQPQIQVPVIAPEQGEQGWFSWLWNSAHNSGNDAIPTEQVSNIVEAPVSAIRTVQTSVAFRVNRVRVEIALQSPALHQDRQTVELSTGISGCVTVDEISKAFHLSTSVMHAKIQVLEFTTQNPRTPSQTRTVFSFDTQPDQHQEVATGCVECQIHNLEQCSQGIRTQKMTVSGRVVPFSLTICKRDIICALQLMATIENLGEIGASNSQTTNFALGNYTADIKAKSASSAPSMNRPGIPVARTQLALTLDVSAAGVTVRLIEPDIGKSNSKQESIVTRFRNSTLHLDGYFGASENVERSSVLIQCDQFVLAHTDTTDNGEARSEHSVVEAQKMICSFAACFSHHPSVLAITNPQLQFTEPIHICVNASQLSHLIAAYKYGISTFGGLDHVRSTSPAVDAPSRQRIMLSNPAITFVAVKCHYTNEANPIAGLMVFEEVRVSHSAETAELSMSFQQLNLTCWKTKTDSKSLVLTVTGFAVVMPLSSLLVNLFEAPPLTESSRLRIEASECLLSLSPDAMDATTALIFDAGAQFSLVYGAVMSSGGAQTTKSVPLDNRARSITVDVDSLRVLIKCRTSSSASLELSLQSIVYQIPASTGEYSSNCEVWQLDFDKLVVRHMPTSQSARSGADVILQLCGQRPSAPLANHPVVSNTILMGRHLTCILQHLVLVPFQFNESLIHFAAAFRAPVVDVLAKLPLTESAGVPKVSVSVRSVSIEPRPHLRRTPSNSSLMLQDLHLDSKETSATTQLRMRIKSCRTNGMVTMLVADVRGASIVAKEVLRHAENKESSFLAVPSLQADSLIDFGLDLAIENVDLELNLAAQSCVVRVQQVTMADAGARHCTDTATVSSPPVTLLATQVYLDALGVSKICVSRVRIEPYRMASHLRSAGTSNIATTMKSIGVQDDYCGDTLFDAIADFFDEQLAVSMNDIEYSRHEATLTASGIVVALRDDDTCSIQGLRFSWQQPSASELLVDSIDLELKSSWNHLNIFATKTREVIQNMPSSKSSESSVENQQQSLTFSCSQGSCFVAWGLSSTITLDSLRVAMNQASSAIDCSARLKQATFASKLFPLVTSNVRRISCDIKGLTKGKPIRPRLRVRAKEIFADVSQNPLCLLSNVSMSTTLGRDPLSFSVSCISFHTWTDQASITMLATIVNTEKLNVVSDQDVDVARDRGLINVGVKILHSRHWINAGSNERICCAILDRIKVSSSRSASDVKVQVGAVSLGLTGQATALTLNNDVHNLVRALDAKCSRVAQTTTLDDFLTLAKTGPSGETSVVTAAVVWSQVMSFLSLRDSSAMFSVCKHFAAMNKINERGVFPFARSFSAINVDIGNDTVSKTIKVWMGHSTVDMSPAVADSLQHCAAMVTDAWRPTPQLGDAVASSGSDVNHNLRISTDHTAQLHVASLSMKWNSDADLEHVRGIHSNRRCFQLLSSSLQIGRFVSKDHGTKIRISFGKRHNARIVLALDSQTCATLSDLQAVYSLGDTPSTASIPQVSVQCATVTCHADKLLVGYETIISSLTQPSSGDSQQSITAGLEIELKANRMSIMSSNSGRLCKTEALIGFDKIAATATLQSGFELSTCSLHSDWARFDIARQSSQWRLLQVKELSIVFIKSPTESLVNLDVEHAHIFIINVEDLADAIAPFYRVATLLSGKVGQDPTDSTSGSKKIAEYDIFDIRYDGQQPLGIVLRKVQRHGTLHTVRVDSITNKDSPYFEQHNMSLGDELVFVNGVSVRSQQFPDVLRQVRTSCDQHPTTLTFRRTLKERTYLLLPKFVGTVQNVIISIFACNSELSAAVPFMQCSFVGNVAKASIAKPSNLLEAVYLSKIVLQVWDGTAWQLVVEPTDIEIATSFNASLQPASSRVSILNSLEVNITPQVLDRVQSFTEHLERRSPRSRVKLWTLPKYSVRVRNVLGVSVSVVFNGRTLDVVDGGDIAFEHHLHEAATLKHDESVVAVTVCSPGSDIEFEQLDIFVNSSDGVFEKELFPVSRKASDSGDADAFELLNVEGSFSVIWSVAHLDGSIDICLRSSFMFENHLATAVDVLFTPATKNFPRNHLATKAETFTVLPSQRLHLPQHYAVRPFHVRPHIGCSDAFCNTEAFATICQACRRTIDPVSAYAVYVAHRGNAKAIAQWCAKFAEIKATEKSQLQQILLELQQKVNFQFNDRPVFDSHPSSEVPTVVSVKNSGMNGIRLEHWCHVSKQSVHSRIHSGPVPASIVVLRPPLELVNRIAYPLEVMVRGHSSSTSMSETRQILEPGARYAVTLLPVRGRPQIRVRLLWYNWSRWEDILLVGGQGSRNDRQDDKNVSSSALLRPQLLELRDEQSLVCISMINSPSSDNVSRVVTLFSKYLIRNRFTSAFDVAVAHTTQDVGSSSAANNRADTNHQTHVAQSTFSSTAHSLDFQHVLCRPAMPFGDSGYVVAVEVQHLDSKTNRWVEVDASKADLSPFVRHLAQQRHTLLPHAQFWKWCSDWIPEIDATAWKVPVQEHDPSRATWCYGRTFRDIFPPSNSKKAPKFKYQDGLCCRSRFIYRRFCTSNDNYADGSCASSQTDQIISAFYSPKKLFPLHTRPSSRKSVSSPEDLLVPQFEERARIHFSLRNVSLFHHRWLHVSINGSPWSTAVDLESLEVSESIDLQLCGSVPSNLQPTAVYWVTLTKTDSQTPVEVDGGHDAARMGSISNFAGGYSIVLQSKFRLHNKTQFMMNFKQQGSDDQTVFSCPSQGVCDYFLPNHLALWALQIRPQVANNTLTELTAWSTCFRVDIKAANVLRCFIDGSGSRDLRLEVDHGVVVISEETRDDCLCSIRNHTNIDVGFVESTLLHKNTTTKPWSICGAGQRATFGWFDVHRPGFLVLRKEGQTAKNEWVRCSQSSGSRCLEGVDQYSRTFLGAEFIVKLVQVRHLLQVDIFDVTDERSIRLEQDFDHVFRFMVQVPHRFGVSIMSEATTELFYGAFFCTSFDASVALASGQFSASLCMNAIQLDCHIPLSYFPVVLHSQHSDDTASQIGNRGEVQCRLSGRLKNGQLIYVHELYGGLRPMCLNMDPRVLSVVAESYQLSSATPNVNGSPASTPSSSQQMVLWEKVEIEELSLLLNFATSIGKEKHKKPLSRFWASLSRISDASLIFRHFVRLNMTSSPSDVLWTLYKHSTSLLRNKILLVAGSLNAIGNPVGLLGKVGEGTMDLLAKPIDGMRDGGIDGGIDGGLDGGISLVKNTVNGVVQSAGGLTNTLAAAAAHASFDERYLNKRLNANATDGASGQSEFARSSRHPRVDTTTEPRDVFDGLALGTITLAKGLWDGLTDVYTQVKRSTERHRKQARHQSKPDTAQIVGDVFKGVGRGLLGTVVKPTVGVIDATTKVLDGVKNSTRQKSSRSNHARGRALVRRRRAVYYWGFSLPRLRPYDAEAAKVCELLHWLQQRQAEKNDSVFPVKRNLQIGSHERYVGHADAYGGFLVLTTESLLHISSRFEVLARLRWRQIRTIRPGFVSRPKDAKVKDAVKIHFARIRLDYMAQSEIASHHVVVGEVAADHVDGPESVMSVVKEALRPLVETLQEACKACLSSEGINILADLTYDPVETRKVF